MKRTTQAMALALEIENNLHRAKDHLEFEEDHHTTRACFTTSSIGLERLHSQQPIARSKA